MQKYVALFQSESREQLAAAEAALLALERAADGGTRTDGAVDALFRAVHTLKGMSATMGYAAVEALAHAAEDVLARVREGQRGVDGALVDALLAACDALARAVAAAVDGRPAVDDGAIVDRLRALVGGDAPAARDEASAADDVDADIVVRVAIAPDAPLPAVRAFLAAQALGALAEIVRCTPPLDVLQGGRCDGSVIVHLRGDADPDELVRAARSVGDVADVHVERVVHAAAPIAGDDAPVASGGAVAGVTVRVDVARLDALLDLVGELVVARGRLAGVAGGIADPTLGAAVHDVARLVGALQHEVLESRTVPVREVFDRFPRLVRDAARALDKRVDLVVEGGDVAVDRAVLEAVAEPLAHLLRNAVDHGIEAPAVRVGAGKPVAGRITLSAARDRDAVRVTVRDDGRGIDRAAVERRARAVGLLAADAPALDDDALLRVIAQPGFSTAERVTSVSGRGVGVDAVVARVRGIGGALTLDTQPGVGTAVTLRLPVTLAIVRALLARVGDVTYAVPLTHVLETIDVADAAAGALAWRDGDVPTVRLAEVLATRGDAPSDRLAVAAVVDAGGRRAALVADAIPGQAEIVVKRIPDVRGAFRFFGGATILDDGGAALILDVPALLHHTLG